MTSPALSRPANEGPSIPKTQTNERKEVTRPAPRALPRPTNARPPAQSMCMQLRDALRVGCITLSPHFFCNTMDPKEMLNTLKDELLNFCILVEAGKTPFGKSKKTYSGKVGGRNDDVVITMCARPHRSGHATAPSRFTARAQATGAHRSTVLL